MSRLVGADDFLGSKHNAYLDAANIALMYQGAQRAIVDWQRNVADNGSLALNEAAEANVFDDLHRAAAGLFDAEPEDMLWVQSVRKHRLTGVGCRTRSG